MLIHVVRAVHRGGPRLWLSFDDGVEGEFDLALELEGEVFEPLRNEAYFARFKVEDTVEWPNGADFAPEFLYQLVTRPGRASHAA